MCVLKTACYSLSVPRVEMALKETTEEVVLFGAISETFQAAVDYKVLKCDPIFTGERTDI